MILLKSFHSKFWSLRVFHRRKTYSIRGEKVSTPPQVKAFWWRLYFQNLIRKAEGTTGFIKHIATLSELSRVLTNKMKHNWVGLKFFRNYNFLLSLKPLEKPAPLNFWVGVYRSKTHPCFGQQPPNKTILHTGYQVVACCRPQPKNSLPFSNHK